MERIVNVRIEKLPESPYLATSDAVQGLVAQGRTITGTLAIARTVARRLLAAQAERNAAAPPPLAAAAFRLPARHQRSMEALACFARRLGRLS
ncbi:MAG: hypothetical protein U1E43_10060 [Rhodospirillales bacterium]